MDQNNQFHWKLASLRVKNVEDTGKREIGNLNDIDNAMATALNSAFSMLQITEPSRTNKSFSEFLTRTQRDRITIGWFSDVPGYLESLRSSGSGRKDSKAAQPELINKLAFPMINISRNPSFALHEGEMSKVIYDAAELVVDGKITANVSTMPVELTYSVWVVSDERQSLDATCAAIAIWLRMWCKTTESYFTTYSRLGGVDITIESQIVNQQSVAFSDLTIDTKTDRVFGASLNITLVVDLPIASFVEDKSYRLKAGLEIMGMNGANSV